MRKRFLALFLVAAFFVFLTGCGGGGGGSDTGTTSTSDTTTTTTPPTTTTTTTPTTDPTTTTPTTDPTTTTPTTDPTKFVPRIKSEGFKPIPAEQMTTGVVFSTRASYAGSNPNWKNGVDELYMYINSVFAPTGVKFEVKSYQTFQDTGLLFASNSQSYYFDNGFGVGSRGLTEFYFPYGAVSEIPVITSKNWPTYAYGLMDVVVFNGNIYNQVWIAENNKLDVLLGKVELEKNFAPGNLAYQNVAGTHIHEIGHSKGLPDLYFYVAKDDSEVLPNLGEYSWKDKYPDDPMSVVSNVPGGYKFCPLNEFILKHNANCQFITGELNWAIPSKVTFRVLDEAGLPIVGIPVGFFESKGVAQLNNGLYPTPGLAPAKNIQTDSRGEIVMKFDEFLPRWLVMAVKVTTSVGKCDGMWLSRLDLMEVYLLQGKDEVVYTLRPKYSSKGLAV